MAVKAHELKFSEVLERARLHESTAQYVLKKQDNRLRAMPTAGSQGVHRRFSVSQALRLSICTHLVMVGIPLRHAVTVVQYCEAQMRAAYPERFRKRVTYEREWSDSWILEIFDGHLVRVSYSDPGGTPFGTERYFDLATDDVVTLRESPNSLVRVEFDLKRIEELLCRQK